MPDLSDVTAVVQPHCHHHSVMGFEADERLLRGAGANIEMLAGCCGLAGNFGMQRGHYEVSVAVAENALLPALRAAEPGNDLSRGRLLVPHAGGAARWVERNRTRRTARRPPALTDARQGRISSVVF